jgi:hypothetical protein
MELKDTYVDTNSLEPNENLRKINADFTAKDLREIEDGLLKSREGYEAIEEPDEGDLIKLEYIKKLSGGISDAARRAKLLLGVNQIV